MTSYSIGVFSRMTRLPISTLRYYHEIELLPPDRIDEDSGYRYYDEASVAKARAIVALRDLGLGLPEIGNALASCTDETDLLDLLRGQRAKVEAEVRALKERAARLDVLIEHIGRGPGPTPAAEEVSLAEVPDLLFGGLHHEGPWSDFGRVVGSVARKAGRHIGGPALSLCHDDAYQESARFEAGFVLKRPVKSLECRVLEGGPAVRAIHVGPYSTLEYTYERMMKEVVSRGLEILKPTREVYLKGPGLIFAGRPEKYRTEVVLRVRS